MELYFDCDLEGCSVRGIGYVRGYMGTFWLAGGIAVRLVFVLGS